MNVSVMGGFAFADTAKNGLSVVVTARARPAQQRAAEALAREIAQFGWDNRARFYPKLTSLDEAVAKALAVGARPVAAGAVPSPMSPTTPAAAGAATRCSCCARFVEAGVKGALVGVIYDPPLAAEAHRHGLHYNFDAQFNRDETPNFSEPWTRAGAGRGADRRQLRRPARHLCRACGSISGRARRWRSAASRSSSSRTGVQCADPIFFEMMGLDIAKARVVVGQVARPFPRRLRRVLRPRADRRGRSARPDLADARPLRLDAPAAPGDPARRRGRVRRRETTCPLSQGCPGGRGLSAALPWSAAPFAYSFSAA